jgi:UDP-N-acetylmuramate dehydrogenase
VTTREHAALAGYTTLRLGGPAERLVDAATDEAIIEAVTAADAAGQPVLVLGGGSNLVVADEGFAGTVVRVLTRGVEFAASGGAVLVTAAAGENWDVLVQRSIADGLSGIECLSGIPGLVGATPIQNVGAYGQEVAQTIAAVRVYDRAAREIIEMAAADCGFGYRTSSFKRIAADAATGRFVVLGVTFRLRRDPLSAPVRYRELARSLGTEEGGRRPLADVRTAVLALRRGKGMLLEAGDPDTRSAGSFFTNPVLSQAQFADLERAVAEVCGAGTPVPQYPAEPGHVKVSAAWLIERAGFGKGYSGHEGEDRAPDAGDWPRISGKHTLALVNPGNGSTKALLELAAEIRTGVRARFGVELVNEPTIVGVSLGA